MIKSEILIPARYQLLGFNPMSLKRYRLARERFKNCKILHFHWQLQLHWSQQTISISISMNPLVSALFPHQ